MRKISILAALFLMIGIAAQAQNYMVVNSEKIFKSLVEYNDAIKEVDELGEQYQKNIDDAFGKVEQMFNQYQEQKAYLSENTRIKREDIIIENEKTINEYQQKVFGQDGELLKKRVELVKPIQDKVFEQINSYAKENNFEIVLDIASNPMILFYSPSIDKTDTIVDILGQKGFTIDKTKQTEELKILIN